MPSLVLVLPRFHNEPRNLIYGVKSVLSYVVCLNSLMSECIGSIRPYKQYRHTDSVICGLGPHRLLLPRPTPLSIPVRLRLPWSVLTLTMLILIDGCGATHWLGLRLGSGEDGKQWVLVAMVTSGNGDSWHWPLEKTLTMASAGGANQPQICT